MRCDKYYVITRCDNCYVISDRTSYVNDSLKSPKQYSFQLCDIDNNYAIVLSMQNARISPLTC